MRASESGKKRRMGERRTGSEWASERAGGRMRKRKTHSRSGAAEAKTLDAGKRFHQVRRRPSSLSNESFQDQQTQMESKKHPPRAPTRPNCLRPQGGPALLVFSLLLLVELMASKLVTSQQMLPQTSGCTQNRCPPVILTQPQPQEITVGPGSNVTLACSASGTQPLTFVWFQDEKNITGNAGSLTNHSEPPPSTKLLDERRYEIQEEMNAPNITTSILFLMDLKVTDTSVFLCWVENDFGSTLSNFSLIVNDQHGSTAGYGLDSLITVSDPTTNLQVTIVLIAFLLLLLLTFICLFILRQVVSNRSSKMSTGSQSSCAKNNTSLLAVEDLDGFFEHMRSGIIDIDHHSMSPAIQFNNQNSNNLHKTTSSQQSHTNSNTNLSTNTDTTINLNAHSNLHTNIKDHDQFGHHYHLTQMNHFPSASNASSQLAFFGSNGAGSGSLAPTPQQPLPPSGVMNQQVFYKASISGPPSNPLSQQAFYPSQSSTHLHQQLQHPAQTSISNGTNQKAFYAGPLGPTATLSSLAFANVASQQQRQQQQAFYGGANGNGSLQLTSSASSQEQPGAFYDGQAGDGQRTTHTLFI